jgi:superfamily II DNA or RNA helicase
MTNYQSVIVEQGLNEIIYQKEFLTNSEFINPTKPVVLAAGTGAGKTTTTSLMLQMFFSNPANKGKKVIILPSSTKVLRDNFGDDIAKLKNRSFSYCVVEGKRAFKKALECDVICVLPQTLAGIEELPKVEWLVVDEAHKWYFANTIQNIITKTNPTYQLLLTGTPFKFNARKDDYSIYYVPVERLIELGQVGNPLIEVVSSSINLKEEDFDLENDAVRQNIKWSYKEDKDQLVTVAKEISKTLKTRFRNYTIGRLLGVFGIDKTIIYCYSKKQANHFYKIFQKSELAGKVLISTSEDDIDSVEFAKFKKHEEYRVLLVVDRGKEGFDMPELFNIIDFTLSVNPEIILQILGRVLRISKEQPNKQKVYYKVASMNTAPFIITLMTGILHLIGEEDYSNFTGKFTEIKIPMMPIDSDRPARKSDISRGNNNNFSTRALRYFQESNIPLTANFWNQLSFKQSDIWKTVAQTTMQQVFNEIVGRTKQISWTKEQCIEIAKQYNTRFEFQTNSQGAYHKAKKMGWLNECCVHMVIMKQKYTFEQVKKIAKQYSGRSEWAHNHQSSYAFSLRKGWVKEIFPSIKTCGRVPQTFTKQEIINLVKKYKKRSDFRRNEQLAMRYAENMGWLNEILDNQFPNNNFSLKTK